MPRCYLVRSLIPLLAPLAVHVAAAPAATLDTPLLGSYAQGHAKIVVVVGAGASGAPAGFAVQWMRFSDFLANGGQFPATPHASVREAAFHGTPTLNTWDGALTTFVLPSAATAAVEVGDLRDETGVTLGAASAEELAPVTPYAFRAKAVSDGVLEDSDWSNVYVVESGANVNCTFTQGFWKNHEEVWPVASLALGSVNYTKAQLLAILGEPARGNGLVILAHQLIATLLNAANGADTASVSPAIAAAHALIGALVVPPVGGGHVPPGSASSIAQQLDDYNNGITGPGHCGPTAVQPHNWARVKAGFR